MILMLLVMAPEWVRVDVATAPGPSAIAVADLNGDRRSELAVAAKDGTVAIYSSGEPRKFVPLGSSIPAGRSPNDVVAVDLNGDGALDLAFANHEVSEMAILLNDGKARFKAMPGSPFPVRSKPHPHGIAAGDWNGDGKADLAIDSWADDQIELVMNQGDRFMSSALIDVGDHPYQRLRSADVDRDGRADLMTTNFAGGNVTVLLGGKRGLGEARGFATAPNPFALAFGDVNRDGHLDVVAAHFSGQGSDASKDAVSVMFGDGKGSLTKGIVAPGFSGSAPVAIAAGDLNGDGYADAATGNFTSDDVTLLLGGKEGLRFWKRLPAGKNASLLAIADLDGDGRNDLAVVSSGGASVTLWFAPGD